MTRRTPHYQLKLSIQQPDPEAARDAAGHVDLTTAGNWTSLGERYFEVLPQSSNEFYRAQKLEGTITHVIETHWDSVTRLIDRTYRLQFVGESRFLNIVSAINVDEANRRIRISAVEGV